MKYFNPKVSYFEFSPSAIHTGGAFGFSVSTWQFSDYCLSKVYNNGFCVHSMQSSVGLLASHRKAIQYTKSLI